MSKPGRNEGCRVLDDFVCEAIADTKQTRASPTNQGRNEGMRVLRDMVVSAGADPAAERDAGRDSSSQRGYNTNLASEFYVMSVLYRLGLDAYLTFGNKKAIDIVVVRAPGDAITIDVKGVAGRDDWWAGSVTGSPRTRHFVVLLSYDGKFKKVAEPPKAWVLPHDEFLGLIKPGKSPSAPRFIGRSQVKKLEHRRDAWDLLRTTPGAAL